MSRKLYKLRLFRPNSRVIIILISIVNTHAKGSYIQSIFHFNLKLLNNMHYILTAPVPKPCLQTNFERDN